MNSSDSDSNTFTYCGDLVGVSSVYANAPKQAYNLLSQFYNVAYTALQDYQKRNKGAKVYMLSDTLIVTGTKPEMFVRAMCDIYMSLLNGSVLLRGGMVLGKLEFDPRESHSAFEKRLPSTERLAKASALEKSAKGARFIVESALAQQLLSAREDWLTLQGYVNDPMTGQDMELQRSIAPIASGGGYEVLYPVLLNVEASYRGLPETRIDSELIHRDIERLSYLECSSPPDIASHYSETIRLLKHSLLRRSHMRTKDPVE
jgi:hypothetical protein